MVAQNLTHTISHSKHANYVIREGTLLLLQWCESDSVVVAAYLLAVLGGNTTPSADDVKKILGSVGAETDDDMVQLLLSEVKGKDITELIASGREKLASVPCGGGGGAVAIAASAGGAAPAAASEPKGEKVEEKEESDDDMGFSLFD
ncbi:hypothetical protein SAY87_030019 [Trapa incisa]|uniref:Uncharacterized protein n=1 Tax=Trapa incisa TaxID=236973 RepID=A0AAN7K7K4_9MYRT|nr:hypothetical protein SAY87_030019 [Trapa incisa]